MFTTLRIVLPVVVLGLCLRGAATADEIERPAAAADEQHDQSWYYNPPTYRPDARAIIHQKAQARAHQRQSRLASLSWYGMSNARPTAAPTPFTSLYSPVWQQPGGRPFAWYASSRPTYVFYR